MAKTFFLLYPTQSSYSAHLHPVRSERTNFIASYLWRLTEQEQSIVDPEFTPEDDGSMVHRKTQRDRVLSRPAALMACHLRERHRPIDANAMPPKTTQWTPKVTKAHYDLNPGNAGPGHIQWIGTQVLKEGR